MPKLKKIGVFSTAKLLTTYGTLTGLMLGITYSFGGLIIDALVSAGWIISTETPGLSYGTVLAFGALIGMPVIFAVFGLIIGIVGAFLYNLSAKWVGGIEMDFKR